MTEMMALFGERFARFWLHPGVTDPLMALKSRHKKADGKMTQFNTGGLIIGSEKTIVMSECQPYAQLPNWLQLLPPAKALDRIRTEIAQGLETPALLMFLKKGEFIPGAWLPSLGRRYVINQPDGPFKTIDGRHAEMAKRLFKDGKGRAFQQAARDLRVRLETTGDTSKIDDDIARQAKNAGMQPADFIKEVEKVEDLNRDEWDLGSRWAET